MTPIKNTPHNFKLLIFVFRYAKSFDIKFVSCNSLVQVLLSDFVCVFEASIKAIEKDKFFYLCTYKKHIQNP
tara:strand:+ start:384 stop:599 length:216 start_codon:yes stop_codon:yes gene_type:complete